MSSFECRICRNKENNTKIMLKGTFYGTKGEYPYFICGKCGCLQIEKMPDNMGDYYSNDTYYSFNMDERNLKNKLLFLQMKNQIEKPNFVGKIVEFLYPVDYSYYKGIPKDAAILDIGCGQGEMLEWLYELGYTNLTGVEPFLQKTIKKDNGITIYKSDVCEFKPNQQYDLITFVHALEHIYNVNEVIETVSDWLTDEGKIAITIPYFSKYYWGKYKENLHTLDPPRHFYIHTYESLKNLMGEYGMEVEYFDTRINPSIPWMAKNNKKGCSEKNGGANFLLDSIISVTSLSLRKKLAKNKDGAIAVVIFRKKKE